MIWKRKSKIEKTNELIKKQMAQKFGDYEPHEIMVDEEIEERDKKELLEKQQKEQIENESLKLPEINPLSLPIGMESGIDSIEHIVTIDTFFQIRIYLPKKADISVFKEKIEKLHKLFSSNELMKIFQEKKVTNNLNWAIR